MNSFDYIVVGAGSAGCVLANRLSAAPDTSVLLIEAGGRDSNPLIKIPAGVYAVYNNPKFNWNYESEPIRGMHGRRIPIPRGRVLGGSSSINAMVYMRGHPFDFNSWAKDFGLPEWDYAHCLPYFKRAEKSDRGPSNWRGGSGPLGVTRGTSDNILYDVFVESGREHGVGVSEDLNGFKPGGLARFDATKWNGKRCSSAEAYLKPVLGRPNLHVLTHTQVSKVNFSNGRVVGVSVIRDGMEQEVGARREVILSGGAINSPQLLMLSGIGDPDELRQHGIPVIAALPGVGKNLQEHVDIIMQWDCTKPVSLERMNSPFHKGVAGLEWLLSRSGPAASNVWEAGGLVKTNSQVTHGNIQLHFAPVAIDYSKGAGELRRGFQTHISQARPTSVGEVSLASSNPLQPPRIDLNVLATDFDCDEMVEGIKLTRELIAQPVFNEFRGAEITESRDCHTDAEILEYMRQHGYTDFHPACTCRMGNDDMAVVDSELRVHGVEGLRVVDASVMPRITSVNLNAPTIMIAEKAADMILGKIPLPPFHAQFDFS